MKTIVTFSGGKDSLAALLWIRNNFSKNFTTVFCDTGWENPITYRYINEIAEKLNTTQKVIYNIFKRNNYKCRVAAKRDQFGDKNSSWKGNDVTYSAFHYRVQSKRGVANKCEVCGRSDNKTVYDWANISGNYEDIYDYNMMCRKCHRKYDKSRYNSSKHVKR